jgi:hypothetical protein
MKLENLPIGVVDWSRTPAVIQVGEEGTATVRTYELDDIALRLVVYSSGFKSDHWCNKGHIVYVLFGSFVIEHEDETRTELSAGKSGTLPMTPDHRTAFYANPVRLSSSSIEVQAPQASPSAAHVADLSPAAC